MGKSLLIYAKDHQDKYPDTLDEARDYISVDGDFSWVQANVAYLGKGGTPREEPGRLLAYNKTLQEQGEDTIVLYRDCHVELVPANRLSERGIQLKD